ncbi:hypothetical protein U3516DRAFT_777123 [Neocallimastix sp. 'constans']
MKILSEYRFDENEVDFISIIIKYMKSIYNDTLICTIIQFAKLNILSSKILYENKTLNVIYRYYFDNFDTLIIKYINMPSREKIDIYLGITFPVVIISFKEIDRCIIKNRVNYLDKENEVRKNLNIDIDEYNDKKNIYDENNIVIKFKEQFVDINKKEETLNNLAKFSLYIESYKEYIYILTEFIYYMNNYIDGFLNGFNYLIKSEVFEIVDKKIIKNYCELSDEIFDAMMKEIKVFQLNLIRINNELFLMLKQIFYLNDLVLVYGHLIKNRIKLKENLITYHDMLICEDNKYLLGKDVKNKYSKNSFIKLAEILLFRKHLLKNEQEMEFITYSFEGFNHNESIISDYREKIKKSETLSSEEKVAVINLVKEMDFKVILFNLQFILLYFSNKRNIAGDEKKIKEFDQHINAYALLEKHFKKDNLLISKLDLQQAIRKLISRFLACKRYKNFNWNIFQTIQYKNELSRFEIISDENEDKFNEEIDYLSKTNIKIEQSIDLYEKLGEEKIEQTLDEYDDKTNNTKSKSTNFNKTRKRIIHREMNYF